MPSGQRRALESYYYAYELKSNRVGRFRHVASQRSRPPLQKGAAGTYGNLVARAVSSEHLLCRVLLRFIQPAPCTDFRAVSALLRNHFSPFLATILHIRRPGDTIRHRWDHLSSLKSVSNGVRRWHSRCNPMWRGRKRRRRKRRRWLFS